MSATTKSTTVAALTVSLVDTDADIVSGTAARGSAVLVNGPIDSIETSASRKGLWSADFSAAYDIVFGDEGSAEQFDADGDSTVRHWTAVPPPWFEVHTYPSGSPVIYFGDWPAGETLLLTIDDPATKAAPDYATSAFVVDDPEGFGLGIDYDVRAGNVVSVTDGWTTKSTTVAALTVSLVDTAADVVSGTAARGSAVLVNCPVDSELGDSIGRSSGSSTSRPPTTS